jgi:hypothetical protein
VYLGPFPTSARARLAKEALEEAFAIRRCTRAMSAKTRFAPCALADMGRCLAPCDGRTDPGAYRDLVEALRAALTDPSGLLHALEERMQALAAQDRFEEAALARDRLRAVAEALWRRRVETWLTAGALRVRAPTGSLLALRHGALTTTLDAAPPPPLAPPCPRERADELAAVRSWICRHIPRVEACDFAPAEPVAGGRELARVLRAIRDAERTDREGSAHGRASRRSPPG